MSGPLEIPLVRDVPTTVARSLDTLAREFPGDDAIVLIVEPGVPDGRRTRVTLGRRVDAGNAALVDTIDRIVRPYRPPDPST